MKEAILIIFLCFTQGYTGCPNNCDCTETAVSCINKDFESVPNLNSLETSPVILDFSGNNLLFVSEADFAFINNEEVREIYLNNSNIADIEFGAFDDLENLQELYLGQNYLNKISEFVIEKLDNMVLLDLSNNYFNGNMPVIRSQSLEVLVLANSKITNVPPESLQYLPYLKLLLLQENNIQTLDVNVFNNFIQLFVRLSYNSWKCTCDNIRTFKVLDQKSFIDSSEPYQCILESNKVINIFGKNNAIEAMSKQCFSNDKSNEIENNFGGYYEVRDMVNEERKEPFQEDTPSRKSNEIQYKELDIKEMNDKDLEIALPGNCWEQFTNIYFSNSFFTVIIISTVASFTLGFAGGIVLCKILYRFRYKKLEQGSDSQVYLLRA